MSDVMLSPGDELLELCLDLRAWAAVHGSESARLRTERDHPLPASEPAREEQATESSPSSSVAAAVAEDEPGALPSLVQLGEQLQECMSCTLHGERTQVVFGCGNEEAEIVFVGGGPGYDEDLQGEPLLGDAGLLLDRIIENVLGLQRSAVYICDVVKCRPPDDREPEPGEVATCSTFLWKQLELLRPEIVVALGPFAAQTLLQTTDGIGQLRGQAHSFRDAALIATYHPADLLRTPGDKRKVFEDMQMLRRVYVERTGRELPNPAPRRG